MSWIPLLSPIPLWDYSPTDYHAYIKSLNQPRKVAKGGKGKKPPALSARRLVKGDIKITTRRVPAYVTEKELPDLETKLGLPANELYLLLKERGFIIVKTHREAHKIRRSMKEIPR